MVSPSLAVMLGGLKAMAPFAPTVTMCVSAITEMAGRAMAAAIVEKRMLDGCTFEKA